MSKRTPLIEKKTKYFKNLTIKKIYPLLLFYECVKCGDEFCREPMYECIEPGIYFSDKRYHTGCTNCFTSKKEFRKYLEDQGKILTDKDFDEDSIRLLFR